MKSRLVFTCSLKPVAHEVQELLLEGVGFVVRALADLIGALREARRVLVESSVIWLNVSMGSIRYSSPS